MFLSVESPANHASAPHWPRSADETTKTRFEAALRDCGYPAVARLRCDVEEGVIRLRGILPSFYQQQVAIAAIQRLAPDARICSEVRVV